LFTLSKIALAISDYLLTLASLVIALGLRLDFNWDSMLRFMQEPWIMLGVPALTVSCYYASGLYQKVWRYVGTHELVALLVATVFSFIPLQVAVLWTEGSVFPRSGAVLSCLVCLAICGGIRLSLRLFSEVLGRNANAERVLVIGANDLGESLIRELARANAAYQVVGLIDDNPGKQGMRIRGIKVLGKTADLHRLVPAYGIQEVIVCSTVASEVRAIMDSCSGLGVKLRRMPSVSEMVGDKLRVSALPPLSIEDLLERPAVQVDLSKVADLLKGKNVLITGAGGSIGSEIARQVQRFSPKQIVLLGRGENSLHEVRLEIPSAKVVICDVTREHQLEAAFAEFRPQVVFHAAAHKHVRYMEDNPCEAVRNNVFGTLSVIKACQKFGVQRFVLLSTDKAVNPSSIMGTTKRLAEMLVLQQGGPGFVAVRFGNVLGSRGSVVPAFRKQIEMGGPVTVSDPDVTRYFMTIPEAVRLVLQASTLGQQGEIYILDMGQPIKIDDLAKNLIRLSGYEPNKEIQIIYTGLVPGEKPYEELVNTGEETAKTSVAKISKVVGKPSVDFTPETLEELRAICERGDQAACRKLLQTLVPQGQGSWSGPS
jgi:FlaA1/EpsC-like NDP-sugar epimerase